MRTDANSTRKRMSSLIKDNNNSLNLSLGKVTELKQLGQGANGLVYSGLLNNQEVAIKFLVGNTEENNLTRFKAEYFNLKLIENPLNIVKYINYEEITIDEYITVPSIIMKKYQSTLEDLRRNKENINEDLFRKLFYSLLDALESIHSHGIIHRDLKPQNILITENHDFILTDFGIAKYNSELYSLRARTERRERIGNYEFSAPEQSVPGVTPSPSMDIYAFAQICQWFIFGETHKGTDRKKITEVFNSQETKFIEVILDKSLRNDYTSRYQSTTEIRKHLSQLKENYRQIDPFEDINKLNKVIRSSYPKIAMGLQYIKEEKYIKRLIQNINSESFNKNLWFNTGLANLDFKEIKYLGEQRILMDYRELIIEGIWLYICSGYDDLIILETGKMEPYLINGEETNRVSILDEKYIVHGEHLSSGYVEIEDEIYSLDEFQIEERDRLNFHQYYFIGTLYHSSIIGENEKLLKEFGNRKSIDSNIVEELISNLRFSKHDEVLWRL